MTQIQITAADVKAIEAAILGNHSFDESHYTPLQTDQTTGHIPNTHINTYIQTGLFEIRQPLDNDSQGTLHFKPSVQGFEDKSAAMDLATEKLIENGIIDKVDVPHFQERAVGGDNRLEDPELKINRAYFRFYGFPSDAIFLNIFTGTYQEPKVVLQKRANRNNMDAPGTFDFAAGGALKYPQTKEGALETQIKEEMGVSIEDTNFDGHATFKFSDTKKDWTTNQTHNIYSAFIEEEDLEIGNYDENEVSGFETVSLLEAVKMCATGQFNRQNTQAFITSLVFNDLLPKFEGAEHLKDLVNQHFTPAEEPDLPGPKVPMM